MKFPPPVSRKSTVSLLLCWLSYLTLSAQQASDPLPVSGANLPYLESLVKTGIDSVRKAHGLAPLRNDSVLFVAAKYHSHYLDSTQNLSHFEKEFPKMYAPSDRVNHFGGNDYAVGENILFDYAYTPTNDKHDPPGTPPHENRTYGELSHDMVMMWVHSPPHYANMLTPGYEFTGVAVAYHPGNKCYYAVQVFGSLPYYKKDTLAHTFFPYDTLVPKTTQSFAQVSHDPHSEVHAWGVKAPEDSLKTCTSCWNDNFPTGSTTLKVKNGNIIFETKDPGLIKQLIDNKRDGFAAEIVMYKPFDCGNPQYYEKASRRNDQCIYNGQVLKPKYRKRVKHGFRNKERHKLAERFRLARNQAAGEKGFRAKWKCWHVEFEYPFGAESYSVSLGKLPKELDGYYEINVLILQKKQLCRVLHFTSFCGEDWMINPVFKEEVFLPDDTLAFEKKQRTYNFTIPFEQGKFEYNQKDIQPFLDSLRLTAFKITAANVNAFASVEGSEASNKTLQQQRANSIISVMQAAVRDSFPFAVATNENWVVFDKQLKSVPEFAIFKGKTHDEIKKMLLDTVLSNKMEPWLAKQRYAKIVISLDVLIYPDSDWNWISKKNLQWTDSLVKTKNKLYLDSLDGLQHFYFSLVPVKPVDTAIIKEMDWPALSIFDTLAYNHAWLLRDLHISKDTFTNKKMFYEACVKRVNASKNSPYWPAVFGMINGYMNYWNGDKTIDNSPPETIYKWLVAAETIFPLPMKKTLDSLQLEWHYRAVPYYESKGKKYEAQADASLSAIYQYWSFVGINDSIALKLCNYFMFHDKIDWGFKVLTPFAVRENPHHDVLMQYIRMSYRHIEEDPDFDVYYQLIKKASHYLTHDEWCSMFVGPCNISFQVFDSEILRNDYCEECAGWKNYGRDPSQWRLEKK
jgi:uncharacterized protein YkwD